MTVAPNISKPVWAAWLALVAVFLLGSFLRIHSFEGFKGNGFDESVYGAYVTFLSSHGLTAYPEMVAGYVAKLKTSSIVFLPPTRISFLVLATLWQKIFQISPTEAVRDISCLASILTLALSGLIAGRLGGMKAAFGVMALMAFAPTQISMAHRAFVDGFFGLLTLLTIWGVWEALQNPRVTRWSWLTGASIALLILTKENAAFVYLGLLCLLGANRWTKLGEISRPLCLALVAGPLAGLAIMALCSGGFPMLIHMFHQNISMNYALPYALSNQDGPWFRYFSDLVLVSPAIVFFAIGGTFLRTQKGSFSLYLILFVVFTYIIMGNIRYGINLRFANMWDFPLRWMAMVPILLWTEKLTTTGAKYAFYLGLVSLLCSLEFFNYLDIFVHNEVYDPISVNLMRALDMIK